MNPADSAYEEVARLYIRVIKRESREAGFAIEWIQVTYGARAAVQAALVIILLKMSVEENYQLPDLTFHTGIAHSSPEALPLLRHAVACCYLAWGVVDPTLIFPHRDKSINADTSPRSEPNNLGEDLPN